MHWLKFPQMPGGGICPDITAWTLHTPPNPGTNWRSLAHDGTGLFVAVGGMEDPMTSPDGITWTARSAAVASNWRGMTYGNGLFVAVSDDGASPAITSSDGITWTAKAVAEADWAAVAFGGGLFVGRLYIRQTHLPRIE